jgi:dsDNA-specific endonuclease/ATPase MutS2
MNIIETEALELLEFPKIKKFIADLCYCHAAKHKASHISIYEDHEILKTELHRVSELHHLLSSDAFFPDIQFEDF